MDSEVVRELLQIRREELFEASAIDVYHGVGSGGMEQGKVIESEDEEILRSPPHL